MKIYIITGNKHKVEEAKAVFSEFNIEVEHINDEKIEPKNKSIKEISEMNAKIFYEKYHKPVIVDDTGVFFEAFSGFQGNHPKLMFELLGYKGLLKLVENESRNAKFKTSVSYYDGKNLKTTVGELECIIDTQVHDKNKDVLPYERILLINDKPLSSFTRNEKNAISHRAKAFRELAKHLTIEKI